MRVRVGVISFLLGLISGLMINLFFHGMTSSPPEKHFNALAPLEIRNEQEWRNFRHQLAIAQGMGIDAIVTDIWCGKVEAQGDQQFNWSYYDRLIQEIQAANLYWIPIFSLLRSTPPQQ
ncbi:glycoside hydrolase family 14 [Halothece sp. PCC 7418]|uniref:family 14 glycosylhydrolase n=1 Tax=Halothece sp. (strain PCC 7418) TaxID=65093 RepID=UPI0002A06E45|nr:family 14 glycosylhydrolase [Halothece sp. PCC 7418]AFZ44380.1 glycoside hydrolase family 14 [Halothece sp. PCC 7418]